MSQVYDWLPAIITLASCDGRWNTYASTLYESFKKDFILSTAIFQGSHIDLKRHPLINGREASFEHIISAGPDEQNRPPDMRRCEAIAWPRAIIDHVGTLGVVAWENPNKPGRWLIALDDFTYVVVLAERESGSLNEYPDCFVIWKNRYFLLWTAYFVNYDHQQAKLRRNYAAARHKC